MPEFAWPNWFNSLFGRWVVLKFVFYCSLFLTNVPILVDWCHFYLTCSVFFFIFIFFLHRWRYFSLSVFISHFDSHAYHWQSRKNRAKWLQNNKISTDRIIKRDYQPPRFNHRATYSTVNIRFNATANWKF